MSANSDLVAALASLRPGAEWSLSGDNYAGLNWIDQAQTKPTEVEITAKIAELAAAAIAETARAAAIRDDAGRIDLLNRLRTATPAQIDSWIDANVTSLATARTVLKAILKVVALDQRNGI